MNNFSILSKALSEVVEPRMNEYKKTVDENIDVDFSDKYKLKMKKLIQRQKKPYFKLVCTTGRRIACAVVAVIAVLTSALSVEAVRETVREFFMHIFEGYTSVSVNGNVQDYPSVIEEEYEIADIPDGFEMMEHYSDDTSVFISYMNGDKYILFSQTVYDGIIAEIDNEHSNSEYYIDESGREYLIQYTGSEYWVVFNNGRYVIQITSNLDKNEVVNLCKDTKIK